MKIDILLSTYNGADFLGDLIQSLYGQTNTDWRLLIRDDGSDDSTIELIESYREKDKERIFIINNEEKHLGPKKSFEMLLYKSEADYMMFCDQDDYWLPDKIESTLTKMKELEQQHSGKPVLVFSDLKVTDKNLRVLHPSLWQYTKVNPENVRNLYRLLVNNPVVGCTVMINSQVKPIVLPFPEQALMHDWWIALNVAQKGVMDYLTRSTILYRLHEKNSIGVVAFSRKDYSKRLFFLLKTTSQNINVFKMSRLLSFRFSILKLVGYKIIITCSKICK